MTRPSIFFTAAYILACCHTPLFAEESAGAGQTAKADAWSSIKSANFTVYYEEGVNLKTVARRLGRGGFFFGSSYDSVESDIPSEKVASRLEGLLRRVKEMLDMYVKNPDLKIKIFKDRDRLMEEYFNIFHAKEDFSAFYVYRHNTIYASEEDISDSVMAHEMGHAVVDHYFSAVPPEKAREILASYVDIHLDED